MKKILGIIVLILIFALIFNNIAMAKPYTVQYGDTLWKIASKNGTTVDKLVNLNRLTSTVIYPGKQLEIPESNTYRVIAGDTFYKISVKVGIPISDLIKANPQIKNPALIYPGQLINLPENKKTGMVYMGNPNSKKVALTFDDGPEDVYTPQILDILKEKDVKATFFVLGQNVKAYPELLQQIHQEGHSIGNHTWDHAKLPTLTEAQLIENVQSTTEEIERITGVKTDLFRPPYGFIKDEQVEMLNNLGYRSIMWTIDTNDWSGASADEIMSRVNRNVLPGGIVLQHNFRVPGQLDGTIEALPQIIDQLRAQGYEFVTVETLLSK